MISTTSPATTRTKTTPPTVMAALPRYLSIRGSPDRETRRDSRHGRTRRRRRRAPSALARTEHDADGTARGHEGQRPEPPGRHGHHGRKGQKTGDAVRHRLGQHLERGDPDHPDHRGADPPEHSAHPRDPPDALEHGHDGELRPSVCHVRLSSSRSKRAVMAARARSKSSPTAGTSSQRSTGTPGRARSPRSHANDTTREACATSSGVTRRGRSPRRSMPSWRSRATTTGAISAPGSVPANAARAPTPRARARRSNSAAATTLSRDDHEN